ncbi:hypothetical protein CK203_099596 [Vitis vinifera]|uniref:Endonuclease/exonuclease/phosphatase domain-containing protein n=1 Tax=Vitis vinifera TaxID=29760 RepID=A0A438CHJ4_VITVI|nr:hypothetical protein CK203_099596 [Vitis vinifera]
MSSSGQRGADCDCIMNLKLLSWNVRGVNESTKRKVIKSVIRKQKVDLFCIQETKVQVMSDRVVRSLGSGRFLDWKALDACGSAGGILICWDKRVLDLLEWEEGQFSLSCRFRIVENGVIWALRVFMARSLELRGSVCGKKLGRSEEFGRGLGA